MKYTLLALPGGLLFSTTTTNAQAIKRDKSRLTLHQVSMLMETVMGKERFDHQKSG